MLTVQTMSSSVEVEVRNGNNQSRYQGNTTGAKKREAAMGQAKAPGDHSGSAPLNHVATENPMSRARATSNCGGATRARVANTGPLKRNPCTNAGSEPVGILPRFRNGTYTSATTAIASAAWRMRIRFQ